MTNPTYLTLDANEAVARVAHLTNEVIAIYPITPASSMGELADQWSAHGKKNIFGITPSVIEMQSEAGAAGSVHGALQAGSIATTFTASQGLLLMIPEMYKIAGQLLPAVFHVAARSIATHALSIFGDHSDVMATRATGWVLLNSASVQEAQDFALIAQSAALDYSLPILHFFDGFRTSHEVNKIALLSEAEIKSMIHQDSIDHFRKRALSPEHPVVRGTSQNPDVFFQSREAANLHYFSLPHLLQESFNAFAILTGRQYKLFDYYGDPQADRVVVLMGSATGATREAVDRLVALGEKVGVLTVRLYRPFDAQKFAESLPATVRSIAVLDRTKEPGSLGEPLYLDVVAALHEQWGYVNRLRHDDLPRVIGGRYGLSSKEFTPAMATRVFEELNFDVPKKHFTIGIYDDVTKLSLKWNPEIRTESADVTRAVFYGLGSDGTVGASKNSVKIIGENTPLFAQGYFVYDSKKSGSITVSHLRTGPRPIQSTYLIDKATFVSCNQFQFVDRLDVLQIAGHGATFLLNSPYSADEVWNRLPLLVQQQIIEKELKFYVIDAYAVAKQAGMTGRINTIMQTCFFSLSGFLPADRAIDLIKEAIEKTYGKRGLQVVQKNFEAVDMTLDSLHVVQVPQFATSERSLMHAVTEKTTEFVARVTSKLISGAGDLMPVSALPIDGTFPVGTSKFEKRSIAHEIPIWDADLCIACGLCAFVCPHAAIRAKAYPAEHLAVAPESFLAKEWKDKVPINHQFTVQVAPDDCTGCNVCVDFCPAKSKAAEGRKAINMENKLEHLERERANYDFFQQLPNLDRTQVNAGTVKGSQLLVPLFEYSGACSGCGETPYLKLMTQLFGDRALIANATGCSSIFGGNLPTTPWTTNVDGRGPAWANSLFEDNSEFGLGIRLSVDYQRRHAKHLLESLNGSVPIEVKEFFRQSHTSDEKSIQDQRRQVLTLKEHLQHLDSPQARELLSIAETLVSRSVWIVGGDGWAYDIGFGGLDHVLSTGANVNILVLDTGVYSNTGGQNSKATPRAAVAKFAAGGKPARKKDLGMIAIGYGNVYVAQVAMGANPAQTMKAFHEAESYEGPSLILAYCPCIAQGIDMTSSMSHQKQVVRSGLWPLYRYDPRLCDSGDKPFQLDSRKPELTFEDLAAAEGRFSAVLGANPDHAQELFELAQKDIDDQWQRYELLAGTSRD